MNMNIIPELDDIADKDSYKLYKWIASKKSFTVSELKKKFEFKNDNDYTVILTGIAMMGYIGVKKSDTEYYSDDELATMSPAQLSNAQIIPAPSLLRYVQKREDEDRRWFVSILFSAISLIISIMAFITSASSRAINVNITSWPSTAETAQQSETISQ